MIGLIKGYIINLKMENLDSVAKKNNIHLSESELLFTYHFIKNNYEEVLKNPSGFNFSDYESHYTKENYTKINDLIKRYYKYL